jgi:hypothetical protein
VEKALKAQQDRNVQREQDQKVMASILNQLDSIPNEFKIKR